MRGLFSNSSFFIYSKKKKINKLVKRVERKTFLYMFYPFVITLYGDFNG